MTASYQKVDQRNLLKLDIGLYLFGLMHTHLYASIHQPCINNDQRLKNKTRLPKPLVITESTSIRCKICNVLGINQLQPSWK